MGALFPTDNYYNYYNSRLPLILVCEVRPSLTHQITLMEVFQSKKKKIEKQRETLKMHSFEDFCRCVKNKIKNIKIISILTFFQKVLRLQNLNAKIPWVSKVEKFQAAP